MWSLIINIFNLSAAIFVLFILLQIPAKTKDKNIYLIVLMLAQVIHSMAELLFHLEMINIGVFSVFATAAVVSFGPTLYFYTRKFYEQPVNNFIWHVIPTQAGLTTIWLFAFFSPYIIPQRLLSAYYSVILITYLVLTLFLINSSPLKKHSSWMKTIGIGFGILVLLHIFEVLWINFDLKSAENSAVISTAIQNIFITGFLLIVIQQIVQRPQTFSEVKVRIPYKNEGVEYSKSELNLILAYVVEEKAFKNPDLRSSLISEVTGLRTNQISEIINSAFKKNFNDWLNDYRIEEAKRYLSDTNLTIQEIYFEVGFNSKSAFNSAFKKREKETPSDYRSKK